MAHGVIYLVAYSKVIFAAGSGLESPSVGILGGLLMLSRCDIFGAEFTRIVETLAALIKQQLALIQRLYLMDKIMLTDVPMLDELDKGYSPTITQCPSH